MNWLWLAVGVVGLLLILKIILKTLKLAVVISIVVLVALAFFGWQHGWLFK